jgi:hypothetical protein
MKLTKETVAAILGGAIILNTVMVFSLTNKVSQLENKLIQYNSDFSNNISRIESTMLNLQSELLDRIKKNESILSSSDSVIEYIDGNINVSVEIVPKEIANDEKIYIAIGDTRQEALTQNGPRYIAEFTIEMPSDVVPIVIFESAQSTRQETLTEIDINSAFALNYESHWGMSNWENPDEVPVDNENIFTLVLYHEDNQYTKTTDKIESVKLTVIDAVTDTEIGSSLMNKTDSSSDYFLKEFSPTAYNLDMKKFLENEGRFEVWVEVSTESGLTYKDSVASFERGLSSGYSEGGSGYFYPKWN